MNMEPSPVLPLLQLAAELVSMNQNFSTAIVRLCLYWLIWKRAKIFSLASIVDLQKMNHPCLHRLQPNHQRRPLSYSQNIVAKTSANVLYSKAYLPNQNDIPLPILILSDTIHLLFLFNLIFSWEWSSTIDANNQQAKSFLNFWMEFRKKNDLAIFIITSRHSQEKDNTFTYNKKAFKNVWFNHNLAFSLRILKHKNTKEATFSLGNCLILYVSKCIFNKWLSREFF